MIKELEVGDWVRSFHIKKGISVRLVSGKMYQVTAVSNDSSLGGFYIVEENGKTIYCLQERDTYLEPQGCWEVCNFEKNLKTILECITG